MVTVLLPVFVIRIAEKLESGGLLLDQLAPSRHKPSPGLIHRSNVAPWDPKQNAQQKPIEKLRLKIHVQGVLTVVANLTHYHPRARPTSATKSVEK